MDEFILRHRPSLENNLIGDDHIPTYPRNLFFGARHVLYTSIWSKQKRKSGEVKHTLSLERKSKGPTY